MASPVRAGARSAPATALDRPWRRRGALRYAGVRLTGILQPPVEVHEPTTPMVIEHNVEVTARDGTVLRVNCYRPTDSEPAPVLVCAHPYGKDALPRRGRRGYRFALPYRALRQTGPVSFSSLTSWEAPDPDWWVAQGYAVLNCDLRGAGTSDGVARLLSHQEGEDVCDLVEWAAQQPWSSGRVGMLGVSYLAITQWRTASLRPAGLGAICPWEGLTDAYRDLLRPGGIPETGFMKMWSRSLAGVRQQYSLTDGQRQHPAHDQWWDGLIPDVAKIDVPTLVCGSFSDNNLHSRGSFRGFDSLQVADRHLYTHRSGKWATFYSPEARSAQLAFFDTYLRDQPADRPTDLPSALPRVRLEVREDRDTITSVRDELSWPPPHHPTTLHLGPDGLAEQVPTRTGQLTYPVRRRGASWSWTVPEDLKIIGSITAKLWVSCRDSDDVDLFVGVEKWRDGRFVPFEGSYGYGRDRISTGWQRLSLRAVDDDDPGCTQSRPVPRGQVEPVRVELGPSATQFRAGEQLRIVVAGRWLWPRNPLTGQYPAAYDSLSAGRCSVHWGPTSPSHLVLPVASSEESA